MKPELQYEINRLILRVGLSCARDAINFIQDLSQVMSKPVFKNRTPARELKLPDYYSSKCQYVLRRLQGLLAC